MIFLKVPLSTLYWGKWTRPICTRENGIYIAFWPSTRRRQGNTKRIQGSANQGRLTTLQRQSGEKSYGVNTGDGLFTDGQCDTNDTDTVKRTRNIISVCVLHKNVLARRGIAQEYVA